MQLEQDHLAHTQRYACGTALWTALHAAPFVLSLGPHSNFSTSSAGPSGSHRVSPSPPYSQTLLNSTTLPPLPVHWTLCQQVPPLIRWLHLEIFKVGLIKLLEGDPWAQSEIRLFLKRGGRTALWQDILKGGPGATLSSQLMRNNSATTSKEEAIAST